MSINFPSNPDIDDEYTFNEKTWIWNGSKWNFLGAVPDPLKVANYHETPGTFTGSTLELETGNVFEHTISANTTYVFANPPATGTAFGFTLKVTVSGTRTITWPTSVNWPSGDAPEAPADGETAVYVFYTTDGGTNWFGFVAGEDMS